MLSLILMNVFFAFGICAMEKDRPLDPVAVELTQIEQKDKRIDALLMVLNEQLDSSYRDTKRASAFTHQQRIVAEKFRIEQAQSQSYWSDSPKK